MADDYLEVQKKFLEGIEWTSVIKLILEQVTNVTFWVKDKEGRFMVVNENALAKHSLKHESEMIGKTDYDLSNAHMADDYVKDDRHVMETRESVIGRVELVPQPNEPIAWYSTTKLPLCDRNNNVVGTIGFSVNVKANSANINPLMHMVPVIDYIQDHITEDIEEKTLASICGLITEKFNQRFEKIFSMSSTDYIEKTRVNLAEDLLIKGGKSLEEICKETGFPGTEDLTTSFKKIKHKSPDQVKS